MSLIKKQLEKGMCFACNSPCSEENSVTGYLHQKCASEIDKEKKMPVEVEAKSVEKIFHTIDINHISAESIEKIGSKTVRIPIQRNYGDIQNTIKENVKMILQDNPTALKNDLALCIEFWSLTRQIKVTYSKDDVILRIRRDNLNSITLPESISRARRELHENKEIEYDEQTEMARELRRDELRQKYSLFPKTMHSDVNNAKESLLQLSARPHQVGRGGSIPFSAKDESKRR